MEYYTQEWREEALCRQTDADLWFPPHGGHLRVTRDAKRICESCPVIAECLEYALEQRYEIGIWGGKTPKERDSILRERDVA